MIKLRSLWATLFVLSLAATASAGSICGTVRDAATAAPVANAGIFLYEANAYTGKNTATAADGTYCLEGVLPGTYDLQVRVDDYQTQWVANVVIDSAPTSVDISAQAGAWLAAPWPNPAATSVSFEFGTPDGAPMELRVLDARGRLVRSWKGALETSGRTLQWDLRDITGRRAAIGLYLVQLQVGEQVINRSFVSIR